jgi:hypothetical protein
MAKAFPQYDLDEEDDHEVQMKEGMRALLLMQNKHELDCLCKALDVETRGRNTQKINRIFSSCLGTEQDYDRVLSYMWEGTLIEYLRSIGLPMREVKKSDPRRTIIEVWRKAEEQRSEFTDLYIPKVEAVKRAETVEDPNMLTMLGDIKEHEKILLHCEHKIRTEKGFKGVMAYFATLTSLRNVEMDGRRYLMESVDKATQNLTDKKENLENVSEHLKDLEDQHEEFAHESMYGNAMNAVMKKMFFDGGATCAGQYKLMQGQWQKAEEKQITLIDKLKKEIARNKERHKKAAAEEQGGVKEFRAEKRKFDKLKAAHELVTAKYHELTERTELFGASDEMMTDMYFDMYANESRMLADYERRITEATPLLLKMLRSENPVPKSDVNMLQDKGEKLLLQLKVFDKQAMNEQKEHIGMWKEELAMARILAMREAKKKKKKVKKPKKVERIVRTQHLHKICMFRSIYTLSIYSLGQERYGEARGREEEGTETEEEGEQEEKKEEREERREEKEEEKVVGDTLRRAVACCRRSQISELRSTNKRMSYVLHLVYLVLFLVCCLRPWEHARWPAQHGARSKRAEAGNGKSVW